MEHDKKNDMIKRKDENQTNQEKLASLTFYLLIMKGKKGEKKKISNEKKKRRRKKIPFFKN